MNRQTNFAILAIAVIIPISGLFVWNTDQSLVSASSNTTELSVIASFYPLYEFTKQVGQDKIKVSLLVPPGIEPHDWDPTISELQKLHESDLIVINGFGFESWIDDIVSDNTGINIIDTSIGIKTVDNEILENDPKHDEHSVADPHIWLNPIMAKIQVTNIANALSEIDSSNENFYQQNAKSYIAKLDSLDVKIKNELKGCKKDFIAFHNAFFYFAIQYNLNQHTIINSNEPYSETTSTPVAGSSRIRIFGLFTNAFAINTRCCCPPDKAPILLSPSSCIQTCCKTFSIYFSSEEFVHAIFMTSLTVAGKFFSKTGFCGT